MIEILNEPKPAEEEKNVPRNIRQIGNVTGENRVYIEDYVYRFFHRGERGKSRTTFVLLGDIKSQNERQDIFVKGVLELPDISYGGGMPVFSEDTWDEIYRQSRQFFPQWSIVGWAMQMVGDCKGMENDMRKISSRHFPEKHGSVFLYDAYGEWEQMYLDIEGTLNPMEGFCIYYEKNAPMSNYLSEYLANRKKEMLEDNERNLERFLVHDETKYQSEIRQDAEAMARYRSYMNGQNERNHKQRSRVALSIALVALVLLSGVLIQNYARLSEMKDAVEAISNQEAVDKAQDEVIKETISKKATELTEVTENKDEEKQQPPEEAQQAQENNAAQESNATPEVNPYLAQGYYIVEKGDRLNDISRKIYGSENMVQAICEKNNIADIDHIQVGDKLMLP